MTCISQVSARKEKLFDHRTLQYEEQQLTLSTHNILKLYYTM